MPTNELAPAPHLAHEVLSTGWLTQALQAAFPGVLVTGVHEVQTLESTATKMRFTVTYDAARHEVPAAFCVKGYFNPAYAQFRSTGIHEVRFYDTLASLVPIHVPTVRYTGIDPGTRHGLVLMDDVIANGGKFFDQLDWYDVDTAHLSLDELASLHARFWNDPLADEEWLSPKITLFPGYITDDIMNELLQGPRAAGFPAGIRDAARLKAGMYALAERYSAKPRTLIHADAHLGNLYRAADGRIGFVDWQNYEFGHWSMDVAYHLTTALEPAVLADSERDLLAYYLRRLAAQGGPAMSVEDAWEDYRAAVTYGYFLWAMTRRVEERITVELTQRLGRAIIAHGSLDVLGV